MIELKGVWKRYKKGSFFSKEYKDVLKCIDLIVRKGEHLGIIGESGAGKSTLSRVISLLELPDKGKVIVDGDYINRGNIREKIGIVGMVFQDPSTSLDPKMSVMSTLKEANKDGEKILEVFNRVGLKRGLLGKYPHQLSGGEQQRIAIARVLLSASEYVIFDEFTSALDVSTQAKIVNLLCDINRDRDYGFVFVSHDVKLVGYLSDRIYVLYKGEIVEELRTLNDSLHPYTELLISSKVMDVEKDAEPEGCSFYNLCPKRFDRCKKEKPELKKIGNNKKVRCFLYD